MPRQVDYGTRWGSETAAHGTRFIEHLFLWSITYFWMECYRIYYIPFLNIWQSFSSSQYFIFAAKIFFHEIAHNDSFLWTFSILFSNWISLCSIWIYSNFHRKKILNLELKKISLIGKWETIPTGKQLIYTHKVSSKLPNSPKVTVERSTFFTIRNELHVH